MHRTTRKTERLCEVFNNLMNWVETNKDCADTKTMGEVIDMIKDIAEAEEKCWKGCYYKSIVEAMEDAKLHPDRYEEMMEYMDGDGRMGYDNWRYASGRYAPKGHGHRSPVRSGDRRMGYIPDPNQWDDWNDHEEWGRNQSSHPYDRWKTTRLGYQADHDPSKKMEMDQAAKDHAFYVTDTMKDIWHDADPALRQELKTNLTNLLSELK